MITRNDIKVGMLYYYADQQNKELFKIVDIVSNPNAGKPVQDMWGGVVWEEPAYTIIGVSLTTGKKKGFIVQSEKSSLDRYLKFVEEKDNGVHSSRRRRR